MNPSSVVVPWKVKSISRGLLFYFTKYITIKCQKINNTKIAAEYSNKQGRVKYRTYNGEVPSASASADPK